MSLSETWIAVGGTIAVLASYEAFATFMQFHKPERMARSAHASLRQEWFEAISAQKGSEILTVQTLRNSLMSATMLASTAALALMGTVTLATPSLHARFSEVAQEAVLISPWLVLELILLGLLFTSLVSAVMAVRFYNHASFIGAIPVESETRKRWNPAGSAYVRKAGLLYGMSLRHLILVVPVVAAILWPAAGPVAAVLVVAVLLSLDQFNSETTMPATHTKRPL